jgi:hypothetical protein
LQAFTMGWACSASSKRAANPLEVSDRVIEHLAHASIGHHGERRSLGLADSGRPY